MKSVSPARIRRYLSYAIAANTLTEREREVAASATIGQEHIFAFVCSGGGGVAVYCMPRLPEHLLIACHIMKPAINDYVRILVVAS